MNCRWIIYLWLDIVSAIEIQVCYIDYIFLKIVLTLIHVNNTVTLKKLSFQNKNKNVCIQWN